MEVGEAWQYMVRHFYEGQDLPAVLEAPDWVAAAHMHQPWKYMLFSDPSLRIGGVALGHERFNAIWIRSKEDRPAVWGWTRSDFDKKQAEAYGYCKLLFRIRYNVRVHKKRIFLSIKNG